MKRVLSSICAVILLGSSPYLSASEASDKNAETTPAEQVYDEMFVVKDNLGNPIEGYSYKIVTAEGEVYRGVTNEKGETIRVYTGNKAVDMVFMDDFDEEESDGE